MRYVSDDGFDLDRLRTFGLDLSANRVEAFEARRQE